MQKLRILIDTSRPISWVNTAYPYAAGYLLMGGGFDIRFIIGTIFFLIPYNLLMYGINDVFDYESDIRNPRKGGVEGAVTPKKYHSLITWSSITVCAPFVAVLLFLGSTMSGLVLATLLFFVVAYSAKGLRFKEIPLLDSLTSSIHFVGPLLYAFSLVGVNQAGWRVATAFLLWGMASHAFGAVQDIVPDREGGLRSIGTVFGAKVTVRLATLVYLAAALLCVSVGGLGILVGVLASFYAINVMPYWSVNDTHSARTNDGWKRFLLINYGFGAIVTILLLILFRT